MSCSQFEELIALYIEGDLPERNIRPVEEHLKLCPACREFAEELTASQSALKALGSEPVDEALYSQMRQRVLTEIGARQATAWPIWVYALAASCMVVLAVWAFLEHRPAQPPREEAAHISRPQDSRPAEPAPRLIVPRLLPRTRGPARPRTVAVETPVSAEPLLVKLITDDPDVVIYWLIDKNGDSL
jgi:anti-sigma factor RsiW